MPITVSATEAKVRLGSIIEWAIRESDDVVIESRGRPTAVLISYGEYESIQQLRERARRREALERLESLEPLLHGGTVYHAASPPERSGRWSASALAVRRRGGAFRISWRCPDRT
jgi:prevent-host-death family protein